jgi:hypothetical protein
MNARKLAARVLAALLAITALSSLEGCVVYGRGPRYYRHYR